MVLQWYFLFVCLSAESSDVEKEKEAIDYLEKTFVRPTEASTDPISPAGKNHE